MFATGLPEDFLILELRGEQTGPVLELHHQQNLQKQTQQEPLLGPRFGFPLPPIAERNDVVCCKMIHLCHEQFHRGSWFAKTSCLRLGTGASGDLVAPTGGTRPPTQRLEPRAPSRVEPVQTTDDPSGPRVAPSRTSRTASASPR